jgi:hypothetical protein
VCVSLSLFLFLSLSLDPLDLALDLTVTLSRRLDQNIFDGASSKMNSLFTAPLTSQPSTTSPNAAGDELKSEKYQEMEDHLLRQDKEIRENARDLLSCLAQRDQIYAASRKAYQQLNKEVKLLIYTILKQIIEREKEALAAKQKVVERLEEKINCIDCESDELEFIEGEVGEYSNPGELILQSQALSILGDIQILEKQNQEMILTVGGRESFSTQGVGTTTGGKGTATIATGGVTTEGNGQMEQISEYFSTIFRLSEWTVKTDSSDKDSPSPVEILTALRIKTKTTSPRQGSVSAEDFFCSSATALVESPSIDFLSTSPLSPLDIDPTEAVEMTIRQLCQLCETAEGRKLFVNVLNQYRSKQVEVGLGFPLLGAVVWVL